MTFHVGQKVVCVDCKLPPNTVDDRQIKIGEIYEVRWYGFDDRAARHGPHVRLIGILRPSLWVDDWDVPYCANRFRAIVEKKTDISIFTRMLLPKELTAPVPAKRSIVPQPS